MELADQNSKTGHINIFRDLKENMNLMMEEITDL